MAHKITIISLAVLFIQITNCQLIGNIGPALLASPTTATVPISLASPVTSTVLANPATFAAPLSTTIQTSGLLANAATVSPGGISVPNANIASYPVGLMANSGALSTVGSIGTPNSVVAPISNAASYSTSGLLANSALSSLSSTPSVLRVTSTSPIAPTGISVYADSIYLEGPMTVSGQLPYLGTIGFEGSLPSSGQGVASCGCGNGNVGITGEGLGALGGAVSGGAVY